MITALVEVPQNFPFILTICGECVLILLRGSPSSWGLTKWEEPSDHVPSLKTPHCPRKDFKFP